MNCIYNTQSLQQRLQEPGQKSKKTYWSGFLKSKNVEKLPLTFSHLPIHIVTFFMSTFHTDRLFNEYREGL